MDSSHERKAVGLQLFGVLLPHMAAADVPAVFSGTFMRTVANSLRDRGSYLHKGAAKCIDRLVAWAEQAPAAHGGAYPAFCHPRTPSLAPLTHLATQHPCREWP